MVGAYQALTLEQRVHAVFSLIIAFIRGAFFILVSGADFIRLLLLMVYVGAIAMLFIFVVMTVPTVEHELYYSANRFAPKKITFALKLLVFVRFFSYSLSHSYYLVPRLSNVDASSYSIFSFSFGQTIYDLPLFFFSAGISSFSKIIDIGFYLYAGYPLLLLLRAILLLVGMLGAILLTVHLRPVTRQQNLAYQVQRDARVI